VGGVCTVCGCFADAQSGLLIFSRRPSIQRVAIDLGYDSAGSFVTMFRKTLGTSPGRYMARLRSVADQGSPT
jgi:AraC-like DNA-binding protein